MREGLSEAAGDELSLQALLYAAGELEGDELAAFEQRLALDQGARDALAQAVELSLTAEGKADQGPAAETHASIRHRLRQRRRVRQDDSFSNGLIGHPALWSLIGALVAIMLMLLLGQVMVIFEAQTPPAPKAASQQELESRRQELEARAQQLAAKLPDPAVEAKLRELARQLVTIDRELSKLRIEHLEKELRQLRIEQGGDQLEEQARQRYEAFIKK